MAVLAIVFSLGVAGGVFIARQAVDGFVKEAELFVKNAEASRVLAEQANADVRRQLHESQESELALKEELEKRKIEVQNLQEELWKARQRQAPRRN